VTGTMLYLNSTPDAI